MPEQWINVWRIGATWAVEAYADGASFGRVLSDEPDAEAAAEAYLAPYDLYLDSSNSSALLDLNEGIQFRVLED